jgi:polysaccharide pyruvyl transferase WcaK-like protein
VDYSHLLKIISRSAAVITTSYHATLAAIYTMTPVLAIYENNYYNLKFTGLKECIESSIFNIENVANIDGYKLQGLLLNKYDKNTVSMLDNLKKYNNKGYDNIYNYINKL